MRKTKIKNIAVINLGYIGDIINASPVISTLKKAYPEAKIIFITIPFSAETAKNLPGVDEVISFDRYGEHKGLKMLAHALKLRIKFRIDIAFLLTENLRSALFAYLIGAKKRIGRSCDGRSFLLTHKIPFLEEERNMQVHVTEQYMRTLQPVNLYTSDYELGFNYSSSDIDYVKALLEGKNPENKKLLGFCPAAGIGETINHSKSWSIDETCKFIQKINETGEYKVVIIGQDSCAIYVEELKSRGEEDFIDLTCKTSITELAAAISRFDKFVTIDSAPMHLAFATKTPSICLFFQDNYKKWGSKQENTLLYKATIDHSEVIRKLKNL